MVLLLILEFYQSIFILLQIDVTFLKQEEKLTNLKIKIISQTKKTQSQSNCQSLRYHSV